MMGIKIGNNNKIKNSTIGNNNSVDKKENKIWIIIRDILIAVIAGLIVAYLAYKFGWI